MRIILSFFLVVLLSGIAMAQDCAKYYYLSSSEVQMTVYDKKGDESGKLTYKISDVKNEAGATTANFSSEMVDEKGKLITKSNGKYKCAAGVLFIDAKAALPGDQMSPYKDMEVKASDSFIEYPSTFSDGQTLKDVDFKMEVYNKGTLTTTVTFQQVERKVLAKESITTPAGTWECYKISYEAKMKSSMAPLNIGVPFTFHAIEWFAPGFGVVKTETSNKNGKLLGSTVITSIKK